MTAGLRRFWVKRPLFVMAAGMAVVAAVENSWPDYSLIAGFLLCAVVGISVGCRAAVSTGLLALLLIAGTRWRDGIQAQDEARFASLGIRMVEARLAEDGEGGEGVWSAIARLHGEGFEGKKVNWIGTGEPPPAGAEMRASGVFGKLESQRNPGTMDRSQRLRNLGVVATFRASEMRSEQWVGPVSLWAGAFKKGFREGIVAGLDENGVEAKTIRAVVIGERARDSLELVESFRNSGTLHVFTVSGLHVAMLGSIVWFLLQWIGVSRRWAIPAIVAAMFGYVWLTGNGPAAVRAAWMGTVLLGAFGLRRRADLLNTLGAVLLVAMIWDPRVIRMPGVQLSYGVVTAIGLLTVFTRKCFEWIAVEEDFLPVSETGWWRRKWLGFRRKAADGLAVSTAASLGSTPLTILHFGLLTPVSVVATVVLVPLVYILLSAALVSAFVNPFWSDAAVSINRRNATVAKACVDTAGFFASIPGASTATRFSTEDTLIIYDLQYGASACCFAPAGGNAVLIDTGGDYSLRREVGPSLRRLGMSPDSVLFTHSDAGHVVDPALMNEMFPLRQVAMGMTPAPGSVAADWKGFSDGGVNLVNLVKGDTFELGGGVICEVLLSSLDGKIGSISDDRCLVFMMHWKGWKILWLGDAGRLSEAAMLASGVGLNADVIIAGLHETDFSLTPDFLEAVDPQAIVIGRSAGCGMDSIRSMQRGKWEKKGIRVFLQQETGGLTVTPGTDGSLVFDGFFDGSETVLRR